MKKITIDETNKIKGLDGQAFMDKIGFPAEDALQYLALAIVKNAKREQAAGAPIDVELSDAVVPITTAMYPGLIDTIELIEADFLAGNFHASCAECQRMAKEEGAKPCPGIMKKGDLLINILTAALRIGMATMLEEAYAQIPGGNIVQKESSVAEFFGPVLGSLLAQAKEGNRG